MAIPVIDFSKLHGPERPNTLALIAHCCQHWGFFQLINHGINKELLEKVKKVASHCYKQHREPAFFRDSAPVKLLDDLLRTKNDVDRIDNVDWEDVFLLSDDNIHQWPSETPAFEETMKEYRAELKKLAIKVMEVMDENLGLPRGYINNAFTAGKGDDGAFFGTKVSHYPPCPRPDKVSGLRAHTDAGGVILLFQDDEVSGLQILKDGVWIDVQPLKNAIVVNTGDQIEVLSNGRYKSVWHRVLASPDATRRSIASFYNPSFDAMIEPAPIVVAEKEEEEEENQTKYPKFVFGDYMSVYAEQKFLPKEPRFQAVKAM
ncbi:1-aminocyclopropane-1-carboxylate oxidase 5 [Andrographis paniculata]|uniref:1-aminocyclopropane-1-carboxylate oxidase 5 n=1 Tax=Andrographis paniculata TaxID=175694 RepID=UPI0021E928C3|nr:1-aminocyclopropane-1-carboxylate oxidase 5 [Andrographis paniculata]